jgi:Ca2+-binding RTX toxin-like protein
MGTTYLTDADDSITLYHLPEARTVFGRGGNDTIFGTYYDDFIYGEAGNDHLYGDRGRDTLSGGDGDDRLEGWDGDDFIIGDAGDDKLYGGEGIDALWGDQGRDRLYGEAGDDYLYGGEDRDYLFGGDGADWLRGAQANDLLFGEAGADKLEGGVGNDYVTGGDGNDVVYGYVEPTPRNPNPGLYPSATDNDTLEGGAGDDRLFGGPGGDALLGGTGYDTLTGGTGADVFRFAERDVVTRTVTVGTPPFQRTISYESFETDTVADFEAAGGDRIHLAYLIVNETNFAQGGTASDAIGQGYIYWVQHGQPGQAGFGTTLYLDRDGGAHNPGGIFGTGDFAIADLQGVAANQLNASHFIV